MCAGECTCVRVCVCAKGHMPMPSPANLLPPPSSRVRTGSCVCVQVRLTNADTLQRRFEAGDTLTQVLDWVDERRTDGWVMGGWVSRWVGE